MRLNKNSLARMFKAICMQLQASAIFFFSLQFPLYCTCCFLVSPVPNHSSYLSENIRPHTWGWVSFKEDILYSFSGSYHWRDKTIEDLNFIFFRHAVWSTPHSTSIAYHYLALFVKNAWVRWIWAQGDWMRVLFDYRSFDTLILFCPIGNFG